MVLSNSELSTTFFCYENTLSVAIVFGKNFLLEERNTSFINNYSCYYLLICGMSKHYFFYLYSLVIDYFDVTMRKGILDFIMNRYRFGRRKEKENDIKMLALSRHDRI